MRFGCGGVLLGVVLWAGGMGAGDSGWVWKRGVGIEVVEPIRDIHLLTSINISTVTQ